MDVKTRFISIENLEEVEKYIKYCTYYTEDKVSDIVEVSRVSKNSFFVIEDGRELELSWDNFLTLESAKNRYSLQETNIINFILKNEKNEFCFKTPDIFNIENKQIFFGLCKRKIQNSEIVCVKCPEIFITGKFEECAEGTPNAIALTGPSGNITYVAVSKLDKIIMEER